MKRNCKLLFWLQRWNNYQYDIRTSHINNGGGQGGDEADFYVWSNGIEAEKATGTLPTLTMDGLKNFITTSTFY